MSMILAQSFMKKLRTLSAADQQVVSVTIMALQRESPSALHGLNYVSERGGWLYSDVEGSGWTIVLKRTVQRQMLLCWVDCHDTAIAWAKSHVLQVHPTTGAMQIVEVPTTEELVRPESAPRCQTMCEKVGAGREDLLACGIPELWLDRVLAATDDETLLEIGERLPTDAVEVVLKIAVGERPEPQTLPKPVQAERPYESVRDRQSWWVVTDDRDLQEALSSEAWGMWCVYLHPSQRGIAEKTYNGPCRVSGSAGTGKTVVALHHARYLLRTNPGALVLVTTFNDNLADDLAYRIGPLMKPRDRERCDVRTFVDFGRQVLKSVDRDAPAVMEADEFRENVRRVIEDKAGLLPQGISVAFAASEFERVVDARNLTNWESYRDALRRGVLKRLSEERRAALWQVFCHVREDFHRQGKMSANEMFGLLADHFRDHPDSPRMYDFVVVDESQDLCEAELGFLAHYAQRPDALFFAGDVGQRIVRYSFSWKAYGIDLRGKCRVLKINYRTTQQIRSTADRLMSSESVDADDIRQERKGTVSLLSGPKPEFRQFATPDEEVKGIAAWLDDMVDNHGVAPSSVAIFFRSETERARAQAVVASSKLSGAVMPPKLSTMLDAKGLEYRAVVVMACDSDVIPSPERLAEAGLIAGLEEIYDTERNLLYVACTRARDFLLVTSAGVPSELLLDMDLK